MKKIFKILFEKPLEKIIFKYIIDDYPYYETSIVENVIWEYMTIQNSHTIVRRPTKINQGLTNLIVNPKFLSRIHSFEDKTLPRMKIIKSRKLLSVKDVNLESIDKSIMTARIEINSRFTHKDYFKLRVRPHGMALSKLVNHDPFTLSNRDEKTLSDMDGSIIF